MDLHSIFVMFLCVSPYKEAARRVLEGSSNWSHQLTFNSFTISMSLTNALVKRKIRSTYKLFWTNTRLHKPLAHPRGFSSLNYTRMPITELVFPTFKVGVDGGAVISQQLKQLNAVEGLLVSKLARIAQADGGDVALENSSVLTIGK
jgi:hypothetical protein